MHCGAVCCSVLLCVVVCCSVFNVLQCVAVRCSVLQRVAVLRCRIALHIEYRMQGVAWLKLANTPTLIAVCCSMAPCVAVCGSVLRCVAVCCVVAVCCT